MGIGTLYPLVIFKKMKRQPFNDSVILRWLARCMLLLMFWLPDIPARAQLEVFDESPGDKDMFRSSTLVNMQTVQTGVPGSWEFHIRHRFGYVKADQSLIRNFLGTDGVANIRFSFQFPLGSRGMLGIARTKSGKTYEMEGKYRFLDQSTDNRRPFALAVYVNVACMSDDFPPVSQFAYFGDGRQRFTYELAHRFSYSSQLILARKFKERFRALLIPSFQYYNLVTPGYQNHRLGLAAGGSVALSTKASVVAEYHYRFGRKPENGLFPATLGIEFGTVGHSFSVFVSSSQALNTQQLEWSTPYDYTNGEFLIGFNLRRTFWKKAKNEKG